MRDKENEDDDTQVYKKPWVGLTDEEIMSLSDQWKIMYGGYTVNFIRDVEAKLKEKNT
jgi:hypothetical protein